MSKNPTIDVLIPDGYKPKKVEKEAAWILANHYKTVVRMLRPTMGYKEKTADFGIGDDFLELKTPTSAKVSKIEWLIRDATKQSVNVVIDMRRSRILENRMIEICLDRLIHVKKLQKIILIVNKKKVLDFDKKTR
jgi:hypothetical protein